MINLPTTEEPKELLDDPVLFWNFVGLELNRLTHSLQGPQTGPAVSSSALGMLQIAIHDSIFAINPPSHGDWKTYLSQEVGAPAEITLPARDPLATDIHQSIAGAAITVLAQLYTTRSAGTDFSVKVTEELKLALDAHIANYDPAIDVAAASYLFGASVGMKILELLGIREGEIGAKPGTYEPKDGRYKFRDDPSHPVRLRPVDPENPEGPQKVTRPYHGPFYGETVQRFSVQTNHHIAAPPLGLTKAEEREYKYALLEVIERGGAPSYPTTKRTPDETVIGHFWAYDGTNLIGTPPRLYNQILRAIAWSRRKKDASDTADFARLLALANTAMADAGIFAWQEKFHFEYWRPLTGVREHDPSTGPGHFNGDPKIDEPADPFWLGLGSPDTNSNEVSFKPPFPAYPSGHATFGAACFQMARLFYKWRGDDKFDDRSTDHISFDFVSDELNGVNRDLYKPFKKDAPIQDQPGLIRTRVVRRFDSLWSAIFENAISRIFLGVHWRFDAFAAVDGVVDPFSHPTVFRTPNQIHYRQTGTRPDMPGKVFPIGGVPLGLEIADEIFKSGMVPTPRELQPTRPASAASGSRALSQSNTNIR